MSSEDLKTKVICAKLQKGSAAWKEMKNFYQESVEITIHERVIKK